MNKVLVVEDEPLVRRQVEQMLAGLDYEVRAVGSAEQGLEGFAPGAFDVVISDVNLPGMDGVEMVQRMRVLDPVLAPVIMTGRRDPETAVRALECGVRCFLLKPFDREDLQRKVDRALTDRKNQVERHHLLGDLLRVRGDLAEKVHTQDRFLGQLIDAAPFGVFSTDQEERILTFNRMAERIYGYRSAEIVGQPATHLEAESADRGPGQKRDHEAAVVKACHRRRDGSPVHVLVHRRDVLDERGWEIAHLYVVEDLTERERMEDQLLYAEKLSLLGQLAPRIAHEFKSPLQLILGHAELVGQWLKGGDLAAARESAGHIIPAAEKLLELVRQMLDLGKPEQTQEETLDLEAELEKALAPLLHLGVIKHCRIERDYATGLPRVRGDSAQLGQVFGNLIVNAAQAMEKQRERVLTLGLRPSTAGLGVELTVGDTGCGMPAADLERVFQPFYTTKPEGTGLGLAIVWTVLDRHRATVAVTSEEGVGTRFVLSFPGVSPPPAG